MFDKKQMSRDDIEYLMGGVASWDLCDHLCKNLIIKMKDYGCFIKEWSKSSETYKLRAAFTLIASSAIHDDKLDDDAIDEYLMLIRECSAHSHEHVKKAVSWALREIGKIDDSNNEKAIILANELKESGNKTQIWIAKDALKEIENLVKVEGRKRLISADSKMGREDKERKLERTGMENQKIYAMSFGKIYPLLVAKAERKGRTLEEVEEIIFWLTGYDKEGIAYAVDNSVKYGDFFMNAPKLNPNRKLIKGSVCGVRVESIEEPLLQEIRYLDKLIDELAKGKAMDKIKRS